MPISTQFPPQALQKMITWCMLDLPEKEMNATIKFLLDNCADPTATTARARRGKLAEDALEASVLLEEEERRAEKAEHALLAEMDAEKKSKRAFKAKKKKRRKGGRMNDLTMSQEGSICADMESLTIADEGKCIPDLVEEDDNIPDAYCCPISLSLRQGKSRLHHRCRQNRECGHHRLELVLLH
jgi:hypothetical protein